jgi:ribosomal protein S18 acetylase RimI-like enzyme
MSRDAVLVRPAEPADLEAIARIDERVSGRARHDYWRNRLEIAALRPPWMSLVAETDGRPVGFLFGWVGESEFGIAARTGWIDQIAVDPPYRGRGIAQALVGRFVESGRELRALEQVSTLVDFGQADVRDFFRALGFAQGPMFQMERSVGREGAA